MFLSRARVLQQLRRPIVRVLHVPTVSKRLMRLSSLHVRHHFRICASQRMFSDTSDPNSNNSIPSKEQRLYRLVSFYSQHSAGLYHETYHATIFLKQLFDDACGDENGRRFARNWARVRAYVCAKGGSNGKLSGVAKEAIVVECNCWCPSISEDEFGKICESAASLNDEDVAKLCDELNKSYPMECRRAVLLNCLCGASLEKLAMLNDHPSAEFQHGVTHRALEAFQQIAKHLGVNTDEANDIYTLYTLECRLKHKYDQFYRTKQK